MCFFSFDFISDNTFYVMQSKRHLIRLQLITERILIYLSQNKMSVFNCRRLPESAAIELTDAQTAHKWQCGFAASTAGETTHPKWYVLMTIAHNFARTLNWILSFHLQNGMRRC